MILFCYIKEKYFMSTIIPIKILNGICVPVRPTPLLVGPTPQANRGAKILQVQPTMQLVHETVEKTFRDPDVNVTARYQAITSKTHKWGVISAITSTLKVPTDQGEILVITHTAFFAFRAICSTASAGRWWWMKSRLWNGPSP
jgi:hypothetical protein